VGSGLGCCLTQMSGWYLGGLGSGRVAEGQVSQCAVCPEDGASAAEGWESWWCVDLAEAGIPPCMGLMEVCCLVQHKGWRAQQNCAAALQTYRVGIWQGDCSFIRLWSGEDFHHLSV
jgi:hypothetical protein